MVIFIPYCQHGAYISQLVRFTRICNTVSDFNERDLYITGKLLYQDFRYHKLVKHSQNFSTDTRNSLSNTDVLVKDKYAMVYLCFMIIFYTQHRKPNTNQMI